MREQIGQKLVKLRGGRTREEVANAIGVSLSAIQMYENGQRIPQDVIKLRLADYYNTSVDELFFSLKNHE